MIPIDKISLIKPSELEDIALVLPRGQEGMALIIPKKEGNTTHPVIVFLGDRKGTRFTFHRLPKEEDDERLVLKSISFLLSFDNDKRKEKTSEFPNDKADETQHDQPDGQLIVSNQKILIKATGYGTSSVSNVILKDLSDRVPPSNETFIFESWSISSNISGQEQKIIWSF